MRIALISLNQHWRDKEANFVRCREFAHSAAMEGCHLIIFPEMTLTGYSLESGLEEDLDHFTSLQHFIDLARETGAVIVFGAAVSSKRGARPKNVMAVVPPRGHEPLLYAKVHLFSFAKENQVLEAGNSLVTFQVGDFRMGASICYDLRFPEIFSAMAMESDAIINIANWPATRIAHWHALLMARAIENQLFMIAVNRTGQDGAGLIYEKSSVIVSPEGKILQPVHARGELDVYDVDLTEVRSCRSKFPTVRDKRFDVYRDLIKESRC